MYVLSENDNRYLEKYGWISYSFFKYNFKFLKFSIFIFKWVNVKMSESEFRLFGYRSVEIYKGRRFNLTMIFKQNLLESLG